ncbi:MAG TPA: type II toxin-antitoxin system ParD family antitoxin [Pararhizobium sp.]|uniref:type II toxin-antitoxin system ParD family antitoxin n=1 Tax=Pararhizobium sp. TaxID=1977563 RepID=UPI002C81B9A3|nr:type II toxin-antitoxin system ParD family antitoxin [Pararhizobium sp.]HTO31127.1 type II toxin-antitoxin system ParD family antitoxin [Pararhizobium sp.]
MMNMANGANLAQHLEILVTEQVTRGSFRGRMLREENVMIHDEKTRLAALDLSIARGLEDMEADRLKPAQAVLDRLVAKYEGKAKDSPS